jgi:hypothetical protein
MWRKRVELSSRVTVGGQLSGRQRQGLYKTIYEISIFVVQYFFGGAMSVFTTRSLLHALGVSRKGSASGAVAVHWVIKVNVGQQIAIILCRL